MRKSRFESLRPSMIKPQKDFPLIDLYKKYFPIHDRVVFAYDKDIYTNYPLSQDLLIHENTHLKQQEKYGLDTWVDNYLNDINFRVKMEEEAYKAQLESVKDRNERFRLKLQIQKDIDSGLYGEAKIWI